MKIVKKIGVLFLLAGCITFIGCGGAGEPVAQIESFSGEVMTKVQGSSPMSAPQDNQQLYSGGAIQSGDEASAVLKFIKDSTQIKVGENTFFEIRNFNEKDLQQLRGVAIYQVSPQNTEMKIQTPHGVATVLGTTFRLDIAATCTALIVEEGKVGFAAHNKQVIVDAGHKFVTGLDNEPTPMDPFELNDLFSDGSNTRTYFNIR